jgi:hypothetical protein
MFFMLKKKHKNVSNGLSICQMGYSNVIRCDLLLQWTLHLFNLNKNIYEKQLLFFMALFGCIPFGRLYRRLGFI